MCDLMDNWPSLFLLFSHCNTVLTRPNQVETAVHLSVLRSISLAYFCIWGGEQLSCWLPLPCFARYVWLVERIKVFACTHCGPIFLLWSRSSFSLPDYFNLLWKCKQNLAIDHWWTLYWLQRHSSSLFFSLFSPSKFRCVTRESRGAKHR